MSLSLAGVIARDGASTGEVLIERIATPNRIEIAATAA